MLKLKAYGQAYIKKSIDPEFKIGDLDLDLNASIHFVFFQECCAAYKNRYKAGK